MDINNFLISCTGSELSGYDNDNLLFKMSVYTISKPTMYKIKVFNTILYYYEKETKIILHLFTRKYPMLKFIFNEHKLVDLNFIIVKESLLSKINSIITLRSSKSTPGSSKSSPRSLNSSPRSSKSTPVSLNSTPRSSEESPISLNSSPRSLDSTPRNLKSSSRSPSPILKLKHKHKTSI